MMAPRSGNTTQTSDEVPPLLLVASKFQRMYTHTHTHVLALRDPLLCPRQRAPAPFSSLHQGCWPLTTDAKMRTG